MHTKSAYLTIPKRKLLTRSTSRIFRFVNIAINFVSQFFIFYFLFFLKKNPPELPKMHYQTSKGSPFTERGSPYKDCYF